MTKLTPKELADRLYEHGAPEPGSIYIHQKSGGKYMAMAIALEEATLTPVVIYAPTDPALLGYSISFTRPAQEFFTKFRRAHDDEI